MGTGPRDELETELELLDDLAAASSPDVSTPSGHSPIDPELRDRLCAFAKALDDQIARYEYRDADDKIKTFAPSTIHNYVSTLRICGQRGLDLVDEPTVESINDFMATQHDDRGLSKSTIGIYQSAVSAYVRYHNDLGVDPADVEVWSHKSEPRHDEQDMFTEAEVDALRGACDRPRDRAFLELLVFTGQRITALRTLRRRDVDVKEGALYLNAEFASEHGGLKGAERRGRKRPLFGATKYVRDWLEYHPKDYPDAWLFVGDPSNPQTTDGPWSQTAVRERLKRMADTAGVDKPVNPHNFRHYFVTVMKRDYGLDADVLRTLLGVAKDSTILDSTYGHVTTEESVRKAEVAVGYREEDDGGSESPLTPDACPTCGELLQDHWRRCPACGEMFAPELQRLDDEADTAEGDALEEALGPDDSLTPDEREAFRAILDAVGDPLALADAVDERG